MVGTGRQALDLDKLCELPVSETAHGDSPNTDTSPFLFNKTEFKIIAVN